MSLEIEKQNLRELEERATNAFDNLPPSHAGI